jgi:diguanylate cyclase (GGDEF)-like protein/PAS domain S-box-containing protein
LPNPLLRAGCLLRLPFGAATLALLVDEATGATARSSGPLGNEDERRQERLEEPGRVLGLVERLADIGVFEWEIAADRVTWSRGLHRVFGVEPGRFGGTLQAHLACIHPEDRDAWRAAIEEVAATAAPSGGEIRIVGAGGEPRWVDTRIEALADRSGRVVGVIGTCQEVTGRKRVVRDLERRAAAASAQALRDPLTGLANRTLALDRLGHALKVARRHGHDLAVLFIDVDGFKTINDRYGHATGDQVLRAIADRFRSSVRGSDTVARIGGDEFLAICEEKGAADGIRTAERLCAAFQLPFAIEGSMQRIQVSVGVSTAPPKATTPEQMVAEADAAMYEAKRAGTGYRVFAGGPTP